MKPSRIVILLAFFVATEGSAATYYTAPNGADTNRGTMAAPFLTISRGASILHPGDTLYVMTGVYSESITITPNGTPNAPIIIAAYPGNAPVIDGAGALPAGTVTFKPMVALRGTYQIFSGFEIRNTNPANNGTCFTITGSYSIGTNLNIHNCYGNGATLSAPYDTLSNSQISYAYGAGILATSSYGLIQGNIVFQSAYANCRAPTCPPSRYTSSGWGQGITVGGAVSTTLNGTQYNVIDSNIVYNNWGEGIGTYQANNTIIQNNVAYDNWALQYYISDAQYITVQNNIAYSSSAPDIVIRSKTERYCYDFADEVPATMRSQNNTLINNYCLGNVELMAHSLVPGSYLTNLYMANNTIVDGTIDTGALATGSAVGAAIIDGSTTASVRTSSGIVWQSNVWLTPPPANATGAGSMQGDPQVSRNGSTLPGQLTAAYFTLLPTSPIINAGIGAQ